MNKLIGSNYETSEETSQSNTEKNQQSELKNDVIDGFRRSEKIARRLSVS